MHERKIAMLEGTIRELLGGSHDMELSGTSQLDMELILSKCNADPTLLPKMHDHDSTNTLKMFWDEQLTRMKDPDKTKRKQWNPVVLRFMLELWEDMGEKNFRMLGNKKILILPSKRQLVRQRAKTPSQSGCDPEAYKLLRKVVSRFVLFFTMSCPYNLLFCHTGGPATAQN